MRFVLAAALAVSFATAAIAAPVKSVSAKAPAEVTKTVSTAHCWICRPADLK